MNRQRAPLTCFVGPMNSSKTRRLLDHLSECRDALNYSIRVYKPALDNRFKVTEVRCRNGGYWKAIPVPGITKTKADSLFIFKDIYKLTKKKRPDIVAIDEIQFFDKNIKEVIKCFLNDNIEVVVSGLNRSFRGEPFRSIESILGLATKIETLTARCTYKDGHGKTCGDPATMTQRLIDGNPAPYRSPTVVIEKVGDSTITYEARCANHWFCPGVPISPLKRRKSKKTWRK
jgi:thymidine kinase